MITSYLNFIKCLVCFLLVFSQISFANEEENSRVQELFYKSYDYEGIQKYDDAIEVLYEIIQDYPKDYTLNLRLGWLYYLKNKYANSIAYYQQAISILPYAVEPKLGLILPLLARGDFDEIEVICNQILKKDYNNYYGNLYLVKSLMGQENYELAEKIANKIINLYPTDVTFLTEKAIALHKMNKIEAAEKLFANILVLDQENIVAKLYLQGENDET